MVFAQLLALLAAPAHAYVYFTDAQLVAEFFPGESPQKLSYAPTAEERSALTTALGYAPPRSAYDLYVGAHAVAVVDDQIGQHEPITVATLVADGKVLRVEVMVYREAYGDGVRAPTFRNQFVGKGFDSPMRAGKDIRIVSGATLSSRALSTAVRRALAVVAEWAR